MPVPRGFRSGLARMTAIAVGIAMTALLAGGARPVAADQLATAITLEASPGEIEEHGEVTLSFLLTAPGAPDGSPAVTGNVVILDTVGENTSEIPVGAYEGLAEYLVRTTTLVPGTHTLHAEYAGDTVYAGSRSADVTVVVHPDIVDAGSFTISGSTLYPVKDGFRDTVTVGGYRNEPISVAIAVRNTAGKSVRTATIGEGTDGYEWAWNGKSNAGTLVAAGRYSVVQTLRDATGSTRVVTKSVTVSLKRLTWHTFTATRSLAQRSWKTSTSSYVAAGWAFTVPKAYQYGTLTIRMKAAGYSAAFAVREGGCSGSAWRIACFSPGKDVYGSSLKWYTLKTDGASHVSSKRVVRVIALTTYAMAVKTVKVTLRYSTLK